MLEIVKDKMYDIFSKKYCTVLYSDTLAGHRSGWRCGGTEDSGPSPGVGTGQGCGYWLPWHQSGSGIWQGPEATTE